MSESHRFLPTNALHQCLKFAKTRPELTLQNADSIAGYVIYERG